MSMVTPSSICISAIPPLARQAGIVDQLLGPQDELFVAERAEKSTSSAKVGTPTGR
jgi:hypothetical protein